MKSKYNGSAEHLAQISTLARKKYDWKKLQEAYLQGLSYRDLTAQFGVNNKAIQAAAKRGDILPRSKKEAAGIRKAKEAAGISGGKRRRREVDWEAVQLDFDTGCSYNNIRLKYKVSLGTIARAKREGLIRTRTKKEAARQQLQKDPNPNRISQEDYINKAKIIHSNKYSYGCYNGGRAPIEIICPIHGSFKQLAHNHLAGSGCLYCSRSVSQKETAFLNAVGVSQEHRQVRIDLYSGKRVVVDGLDRANKVVYEFDGDFWHGNPSIYNHDDINPVTKCTFGDLYRKTQIRLDQIVASGYTVVRVWESELSEYIFNLGSSSGQI